MYLHVHFLSCFLTSKKKWIERIGGKSSFNGEFWIYIPVVKHLQIFIVSNVEYTKKLASLFKWKLYKCKMVNCKMHKIFRFTFVKQSAVLCWRTEHYELQPWNILTLRFESVYKKICSYYLFSISGTFTQVGPFLGSRLIGHNNPCIFCVSSQPFC